MDKSVQITLAIMIPIVIIFWFLGLAWVMSPQEFTFKVEMDNNTLDSISNMTGFYEEYNQYKEISVKCNNMTYTRLINLEFDMWASPCGIIVMKEKMGNEENGKRNDFR